MAGKRRAPAVPAAVRRPAATEAGLDRREERPAVRSARGGLAATELGLDGREDVGQHQLHRRHQVAATEPGLAATEPGLDGREDRSGKLYRLTWEFVGCCERCAPDAGERRVVDVPRSRKGALTCMRALTLRGLAIGALASQDPMTGGW